VYDVCVAVLPEQVISLVCEYDERVDKEIRMAFRCASTNERASAFPSKNSIASSMPRTCKRFYQYMTRRRPPVLAAALAYVACSAALGAAQSSCQTLVFSGLSTRCDLDGSPAQTTACCSALDDANGKRCFCEAALMSTITLVIGEQGVNFFREFAKTNCSGALLEGRACSTASPSTMNWNITAPPPPPPMATLNYNQHREQAAYERDLRPASQQPASASPTRLGSTTRPSAASQTVAEYVFDPRRDADIGFTADVLALSGLRNVLVDADEDISFTFFIPVNNAWYTLLIMLGSTKAELFDDPDDWLAQALRYHVVVAEGVVRTQSMDFGTSARSMFGATLQFEKFYERRTASSAPAIRVNGCSIHPTRRDIDVKNGVVHYIDCVLLPGQLMLPTRRTTVSYIASRPELSMFYNALRGTALLERLERRSFDLPLTIFAPNNDAFMRFIASSPTFYIDNPEERWANPDSPTLYETLMYHVVLGRYVSTDLSASRTPDALVTDLGQRVFIQTHRSSNVGRSSGAFVNGCQLVGDPGEAFAADGVVHEIDCVLVPDFDLT